MSERDTDTHDGNVDMIKENMHDGPIQMESKKMMKKKTSKRKEDDISQTRSNPRTTTRMEHGSHHAIASITESSYSSISPSIPSTSIPSWEPTSSGLVDQSFDSAVHLASKQFIQGFVFGQISLCILLFVLVRVFLLRNGDETRKEITKYQNSYQRRLKIQKQRHSRNGANDEMLPAMDQQFDNITHLNGKKRSTSVSMGHGHNPAIMLGTSSRVKVTPPSPMISVPLSPIKTNAGTLESIIFSKTSYDYSNPPRETCGWINVVLAWIISQYRDDPTFVNRVISNLDEVLNGNDDARHQLLGPILITDFSLGEGFPLIRNVRVCPLKTPVLPTPQNTFQRFNLFSRNQQSRGCTVTSTDELEPSNVRVEFEFEFDDQISLGIETSLLVNWPRSGIASLPIALVVSIIKFSGTVSNGEILLLALSNILLISFLSIFDIQIALQFHDVAGQKNASNTQVISLTLLDNFILEFDIHSLLGHRTKIKNLPKISSMITSKLRTYLLEKFVDPNFLYLGQLPVPWRHDFMPEKKTENALKSTTNVENTAAGGELSNRKEEEAVSLNEDVGFEGLDDHISIGTGAGTSIHGVPSRTSDGNRKYSAGLRQRENRVINSQLREALDLE